ncbi:hypothetical protein SDC9_157160 [bioreactor metagenome]|uniref:N-acetyltransferase domain-containing protein n=1 Tax=bioreactor metagenome TaxID=1076179 RepID=A0A645F6Q3_9ZZZZ
MNLPDIVKSLHTVKTSLNEWENTYSMWLSDKYEKNFIIYSYEKPVGWMKLNGFDGDAVWISMLVILPEYQRKGFGCFAINCAEKFAADCGFEKTCIHTQSDNIKAQGCYVKCGYKAIEEYECTCGDGEKLIGYTFEKKLEN